MSSGEVILPTTVISDSSAADPALVRFTGVLTETPDAKTASGIADTLLIFLSAGGTLLRCFASGRALFPFLLHPALMVFIWTFLLLVCVGVGGSLGCLAVMATLNARDLSHGRDGFRSVAVQGRKI
jgi:hypothetical protein